MLKRNENQYVYLLNCINLNGYDLPIPQENMTKREIVSALQEIAKKELQTNVLTQKDLTSWLAGLPSSIGIDFSFTDIEKKLIDFGIKATDKNVNNWFNVMSYRLLQMFNALDNNKTSWFFDK